MSAKNKSQAVRYYLLHIVHLLKNTKIRTKRRILVVNQGKGIHLSMKGIQQTKCRLEISFMSYMKISFFTVKLESNIWTLPNVQFQRGTVQGILMTVHEILIGHFCKCSYTHYPLQNHVWGCRIHNCSNHWSSNWGGKMINGKNFLVDKDICW